MSGTDPFKVQAISEAARNLNPADRDAYLVRACAGDAVLRAQVEALLRAAAEDGTFGSEDETTDLPSRASVELAAAHGHIVPGMRLGRYKLLQLLGEGGFGTVFMAEQEEPVRRRVALKVIKLGMDTKQVIARFGAERQALALMDHPNVAKVFDAGATPSGRPYFVMELIRGDPITQYCDSNRLPIVERLELFITTCQAVQHAHQKGIIHRDIKPSNVLVTIADDKPVPKVIDFGIAKATSLRLTDKTLYTQLRELIGTPEYMSPEQAEMSGVDIDTRSDVYSLGVLLYELLTGTTPFEAKQLRSAPYHEIQRIIREVDPPRPSVRLRALSAGLDALAVRRKTEPRQLERLVRGELDWIVTRALEKDRTRRYATANGLAADVRRFLDGEPVVAAPPSKSYRLRKLARRNRAAFAAGSAVVLALVLGLGAATYGLLSARSERELARASEQRAKMEALKQEAVTKFLQDMLSKADRGEQRGNPDVRVREVLDTAAKELETGAVHYDPEVEASVRHTIGETYLALGLYPEAATHLRAAVETRRHVLGGNHPDVAASVDRLATALQRHGNLAAADSLFRVALEIRRKALGEVHLEVAKSMNNLALVRREQGDLVGAETLYREALALKTKLLGGEDSSVATTLQNLANVLRARGSLIEADSLCRKALGIRRHAYGNEHPDVAQTLGNLGLILRDEGKLAQADSTCREALALYRKLYGNEHPETATPLNNLGLVLTDRGSLEEAESVLRQAVEIRRRALSVSHPFLAVSLEHLGNVRHLRRDDVEAEALLREALSIHRKTRGPGHSDLGRNLDRLSQVLRARHRPSEAEPLLREYVNARGRSGAADDPQTGRVKTALAETLLDIETARATRPGVVDAREATARLAEVERLLEEAWAAGAVAPGASPTRNQSQHLERTASARVRLSKLWRGNEPSAHHDVLAASWQAQLDSLTAADAATR